MAKYIFQQKNWTAFTWDEKTIGALFGEVRYLQGQLTGRMTAIGITAKAEATLNTLTMDVVKSSEIEGEVLNQQQVRSSIARRLGINTAGLVPASRHIDGVVAMMLDATQNYQLPLTANRLFGWHAALFPTGFSGMHKIEVGQYRTGEMQGVSGAMGQEKLHNEAVPAALVKAEMDLLLNWLNNNTDLDNILKAAIAHFWFIIIHPFDDGNGRIARAIADMLLARSESSSERFYSLSTQILADRKQYYAILQKVQHSTGDITAWLVWFLQCMKNAMLQSEQTLQLILQKTAFWKQHENAVLNQRQRLIINKMLDGFDGKLQSSKWAKIAKCSTDTALRDIKDLVEKGILIQEAKGGRSTNYQLLLAPEM